MSIKPLTVIAAGLVITLNSGDLHATFPTGSGTAFVTTQQKSSQEDSPRPSPDVSPWETPTGLLLLLADKFEHPSSRLAVFRKVAAAQLAAGDREGALVTLNRALEIAQSIENQNGRAIGLRDVASDLARIGEFPQAAAVSDQIELLTAQSVALSNIAIAQFEHDMQQQAVETLGRSIEVAQRIGQSRNGSTASTLSSISKGLAEAGLFEQAEKVALTIQDVESRASALRAISLNDQDNRRAVAVLDQAVEAANQITNERTRGTQLRRTVLQLVAVKAFDRALEVALTIENEYERHLSVGLVAKYLVQDGETQRASEVARRHLVGEAGYASTMLEQVAKALLKSGDFEHATEFIAALGGPMERALAMMEATKELVEAGKIDEAVKLTEADMTARDRVIVLSGIATALARAGDRQRALDVLKQALQQSQTVENARDRCVALNNIASAMSAAEDHENALNLLDQAAGFVEQIGSEKDQQQIRWMLLMTRIGVGDRAHSRESLEHAENLLDEIQNTDFKLVTLRAIARAHFSRGDHDRALRTLDTAKTVAGALTNAKAREHALHANAMALMNVDQIRPALELVQMIQNPGLRASAFRSILNQIREPGKVEQALDVMAVIEDQSARRSALNVLISSLLTAGEIETALELTQRFPEAKISDFQLKMAAERLARVEKIEQAIRVAQCLDSKTYLLPVLNQIGFVLATEAIPKADDESHSPPARRLKSEFRVEEQQLAKQIVEMVYAD